MKTIRIQLKVTAVVYVGEDIVQGEPAPNREPDGLEVFSVTRDVPIGPRVGAGDAVSGHLCSMIADTIKPLGESLRHELRQKNL